MGKVLECQLRVNNMRNTIRAGNSILFSLWKDNKLISRAEVKEQETSFGGNYYKIIGVSGVLTRPLYCRQGYGTYLMKVINQYILAANTDMGMLFCQPALISFYKNTGWELCGPSETRVGTPSNYRHYVWQRLILSVSPYVIQNTCHFTTQPCYIRYAW